MLRSRRKGNERNGEQACLALADEARDLGDWGLAARHYREVLARNPGLAGIWVQYGHALKEGGGVADAERAYRKAIELDGGSADSHVQLGHALKMQGRREEAAASYLKALSLDQTLSPAARELVALCWDSVARVEAGWNQHSPAFINAAASVGALAHEQARLSREIEELRRALDALAGREGARANGQAAAGALPGHD